MIENPDNKNKRWHSIKSNHKNDSKRESEWMKFLMQELELAKVVEEHDTDNKCLVSTPPPAVNNKPSFSLPVSWSWLELSIVWFIAKRTIFKRKSCHANSELDSEGRSSFETSWV